jgi:two-component system alkaline phosphatase synthesis response regulator PhoP
MSNPPILIVEDEVTIAQTVRAYLEQAGFAVHVVGDGIGALDAARSLHPGLIILDIMLPGMDGLDVLRRLRQESQVYVLMLTAKTEETDKLLGLGLGADDYLTKPFSPRELVARVKAILRRERDPHASDTLLRLRRLRIDASAHRCWLDNVEVELTAVEFNLLLTLARHCGRVLSREQLIEHVWGNNFYGDDRVVDVHLGRLRKKIEDDPTNPTLIVTVRGVGYRLADAPL